MINAYNFFKKLSELKDKGEVDTSIMQELNEIFHELPSDLRNLIQSVVEDGRVDSRETRQIREYIYRNSQPGGYEIRLLFEIHDRVFGKENDAEWDKLFLDETEKYFQAGADESRKLPLAKAALLLYQIKNTINRIGIMSDVEIKLIKNLIRLTGDATFMKTSDSHFLSELYDKILRDSQIDLHEVEILQEMVFQDNPPMKEDMDLLFDINRAIKDKQKHEKWQELFVQAVSTYMTNNTQDIDYNKITWLEGKLQVTVEKHKGLTAEEMVMLLTLKKQVEFYPPELDRFHN